MANPTFTGVEIFPPIGIARVGDSSEYNVASEDPSREHELDFKAFRDNVGKIKRSAVKFHAYLYDADGNPTTEAKAPDYTIKWTVNVANKKAAWVRNRGKHFQETFRLRNPSVQPYPIDAPPSYEHTNNRTDLIIRASAEISGLSAGPIPLIGDFKGSVSDPTPVKLGEIRTDEEGRLLFLAGTGDANCVRPGEDKPDLLEKFDNEDWYDTMCDGNVTVEVSNNNNEEYQSTLKTIVIGGPPKFASGMYCPTPLYDLIEDIYKRPARAALGHTYDCGPVYYDEHIEPIFEGVRRLSWTNKKANEGHGPYKASRFSYSTLSDNSDASKPTRKAIFERVRAPVKPDDPANKFIRNKQAYDYYMPRLGGGGGDIPLTLHEENYRDKWASLTELQYERLTKWAEGDFEIVDPGPPKSETEIYTLAALKFVTGGPCFPGIEIGWVAEGSDVYNPDTRFRFHDDVQPGDLTKALSLPWQSDFYMCKAFWWPHVRPDAVVSEETWNMMKEEFPEKVPAEMLTKRDLWDEGLATDDPNFVVGNTEMTKKWDKLGFVYKVQSDPDIYVETARLLPHGGTYTIFNIGQSKFVGQGPDIGTGVKPIVVVDKAQTWDIDYVDGNLRLTIAGYTAATHGGGNVNSYKFDQRGTWIIEASGTSGYKIRTLQEPPVFWTLNPNETQVTVAETTDNQIWQIALPPKL